MHKEARKERRLYNFSIYGEDRVGVNSKKQTTVQKCTGTRPGTIV